MLELESYNCFITLSKFKDSEIVLVCIYFYVRSGVSSIPSMFTIICSDIKAKDTDMNYITLISI